MATFQQLITDYGLDDLFNKNDATNKKKIIDELNKPTTACDKEGFVYGFTKETDKFKKTNFKVKLGRTERTPQIRIQEWGGKERFSRATIFNRKLERLIILFFKFANFTRKTGDKNEVEWYQFNNGTIGTEIVTISLINQYVIKLDDLVEKVYGEEDEESEEEKSEDEESEEDEVDEKETAINKTTDNVKSNYNEISQLAVDAKSICNEISQLAVDLKEESKQSIPTKPLPDMVKLSKIATSYYSGYFHVPERRYLFDSLRTFFEYDSDCKITSLNERANANTIINDNWWSSKTFKVGERRVLLSMATKYVKYYSANP